MTRYLTRAKARTAITTASIILGSIALTACETVEGFGRDVQSGGAAVEDSSENVQREMNRP